MLFKQGAGSSSSCSTAITRADSARSASSASSHATTAAGSCRWVVIGISIALIRGEPLRSIVASRGTVIIGAGVCGGNAAVTLREEGYRERVVLIGCEPGTPFGRPPLSKEYLRGEEDLSAWQVKPHQ